MDLALISLLKKKPLAYITVSEICKAAGVNRSTFYLHYESIGDLLNETTRYLLDDFRGYYSDDMKAALYGLKDRDPDELIFITDEYLTPYLTYIRDHKEVFGVALLHNKTLGFEIVYQRMFDNIFDPILDKFHYPPDTRQYVMMYYLNGINAIIAEWIKNGCTKPIKEISEIISVCIYGKNTNE